MSTAARLHGDDTCRLGRHELPELRPQQLLAKHHSSVSRRSMQLKQTLSFLTKTYILRQERHFTLPDDAKPGGR